jgi:hypothetical protein
MAPGDLTFDKEHWPLVVMTLTEAMSVASVGQIAAHFNIVFARKEPFALLVDTTPVKTMPSATWRREMTDWAGNPDVQAASKRYNVGAAVVLSSSFARGAFIAIGWLWKPASPVSAFATTREAVDWCSDQLVRANVARSPKLFELQRSLQGEGKRRSQAR